MITKRVFGRLVMIAGLAAMTAGVMPAGACNHCRWQSVSSTDSHTYGEQSSLGSPFDLMLIWLETFTLPML